MGRTVKPVFTPVKPRLIAGASPLYQTQVMLDREQWRKQFVAAAKPLIDSGKLDRTAIVRHFGREDATVKAAKQAVYDWFRSGKISDDRLSELATFCKLDVAELKLHARFVPAAPVKKPGRSETPPTADLIRQRVATLDGDVQRQILGLVETMCALANPGAWDHEAKAHRKALAVHEKPGKYSR